MPFMMDAVQLPIGKPEMTLLNILKKFLKNGDSVIVSRVSMTEI